MLWDTMGPAPRTMYFRKGQMAALKQLAKQSAAKLVDVNLTSFCAQGVEVQGIDVLLPLNPDPKKAVVPLSTEALTSCG